MSVVVPRPCHLAIQEHQNTAAAVFVLLRMRTVCVPSAFRAEPFLRLLLLLHYYCCLRTVMPRDLELSRCRLPHYYRHTHAIAAFLLQTVAFTSIWVDRGVKLSIQPVCCYV